MYGENENNQDYNQTTEGESFESNEHTEQAKEQVQDTENPGCFVLAASKTKNLGKGR